MNGGPGMGGVGTSDQDARARRRAAMLSVIIGVVLLGAKLLAYRWTGSAAILSDALESIINVVASILALYTIIQGAKPPDEDHPYGHGKAEDFSAGVEGALIFLAALLIFAHAIPRLFDPVELSRLGAGLGVVAVAGVVNGITGAYLIAQGKRHSSRALVADGYHLLADTITSAGVVIGLIAVSLTGWLWLDPLAACAVALHILVAGFKLVRESVARLMDQADDALLDRIAESLQRARQDAWIDVHQLRAWRSGDYVHVDFHMVVPHYWTIERGHAAQEEAAAVVLEPLNGKGEVIVHLDPCEPRHCRQCVVQDCPVRSSEFERSDPWIRESLIRPPDLAVDRLDRRS